MDRWVGSGVGAGERVERERRRGGTVNVSGRPGRVLEREGQTVVGACGGCVEAAVIEEGPFSLSFF